MGLTAFTGSRSWSLGFHNAALGPFESLTKASLRIIGGNLQSTGDIPPGVTGFSEGEHFPRYFVQKCHYLFDEQFLLNGVENGSCPNATKRIQILDGADGFYFGLPGQLSVQAADEGPINVVVEVSNGPHESSVALPGTGEGDQCGFEEVGSSR